jgi:hypothetical protein
MEHPMMTSLRERARIARLAAISEEEQAEAAALAAKQAAARQRAARLLGPILARTGIARTVAEAEAFGQLDPSALVTLPDSVGTLAICYWYPIEDVYFALAFEDGSGGAQVGVLCEGCQGLIRGPQGFAGVQKLADLDQALEKLGTRCNACRYRAQAPEADEVPL